jgi:hypothetical protein
MAYDYFPKDISQIATDLAKLPNYKPETIGEIISLYTYLRRTVPIDTPINIDKRKPNQVNVARAIDGTLDLNKIRREAKLNVVKIKYGNGSSGNRGKNNRGNLFEPLYAQALLDWWAGDEVKDKMMLESIEDLDKTYNIRNSNTFKVDVVGGENTKRPLQFAGSIKLQNPKGSGYDIGKSVTDITLTLDRNQKIFLSLKLGTTTTFFNVGVRTILTPQEIKKGDIKNTNGKKLLNLFGIDESKFCDVFNGDLKRGETERFNPPVGIDVLMKSGIGMGYHIIHKMRNEIISKKMDTPALSKASRVTSGTIYYGGKTGTGKRIDVEFESLTYKFKINIRDTQGRDGYPTRMMCDFSYK